MQQSYCTVASALECVRVGMRFDRLCLDQWLAMIRNCSFLECSASYRLDVSPTGGVRWRIVDSRN